MEEKVCPKCGRKYMEFPALSRKDNETEICPQCGLMEALEDWANAEGAGKRTDVKEG